MVSVFAHLHHPSLDSRLSISPKMDVMAGMHLTTANVSKAAVLRVQQLACEVAERDVGNLHLARTGEAAVVTVVLRDEGSARDIFEFEVLDKAVADSAPSTAAWLAFALVAVLRDKVAHPGLDVDAPLHIPTIADHLREGTKC